MTAVLFDRHGAVAWITINRPDRKNVMNPEVLLGLADAWAEFRGDESLRVAVVTGAGDEDFCCGGDLGGLIPLWTRAIEPTTEVERRLLDRPHIIDDVMLKAEPLDKPVIAAINGRALGGGLELVQATDIRIAASTASFGLPEPKSGVVPGAGSMVRLARQLPYAHAMRIFLGGEPVDADTALGMGLVSEVVSPADLRVRVEEVAARVAEQAPLALRAIKRTVLATHTMSWDEAFELEKREAGGVMRSADAREGPRAFKERRSPRFEGR
ncbi:MAG: enoyl-CoA hydratase-related protein [Actinomycetota bacterium]